jgi:probable F420-dependent oxidoreductase
MKLSVGIPMGVDDRSEFQSADAVREMAQALERAGVDACNVTDHPAPSAKWRHAGGHDALDPFAALSFVAATTRTLKLHTHIVVLPYRNPFLTAKGAATLDVLSGGRLILGVGAGYLRGEFAALGADFEGRVAAMDEAIETITSAWGGEPVARAGRAFTAVDNLCRPCPVQKPHPPIWAGGNSDRAIQRAAELCDGWSPFLATAALSKTTRTDEINGLEDLAPKIQVLRAHLDRLGRSSPFEICFMPLHPLEACDAAEAQRLVDEAGAMARLGVTWLVVALPHPSRAAYLEHVHWLGQDVLPRLS